MVNFCTKNANFGIFWKALGWKFLVCGHLVFLWPYLHIGIFLPALVCCKKINLATLLESGVGILKEALKHFLGSFASVFSASESFDSFNF
jgi:hypothetical protein